LAVHEEEVARAAPAHLDFHAGLAGNQVALAHPEFTQRFPGDFDLGLQVGFVVGDREPAVAGELGQFGLGGRVDGWAVEVAFGNLDGQHRTLVALERLFDAFKSLLWRFDSGDERRAFLIHDGTNLLREIGGEVGDGCARAAFDHFAIDAAGFRADDLGDDHGVLVHFEHAAGDEHLGAGQLANFGSGVGADGAREAEFLFAQDLLQLGAFHGDEGRFGGQGGVDKGGNCRPEIAHGFVSRFEVEDGDGEDVPSRTDCRESGKHQCGQGELGCGFHNLVSFNVER
jgi:hypothetical protein